MAHRIVYLLVVSSVLTANAFVLEAPRRSGSKEVTRTTELCLLPTQGNQLVAAGTSAYDEDAHYEPKNDHASGAADHQSHESSYSTATRSMAAAARTLVNTAVVALLPHGEKKEDEVVFPLTGFALVCDEPDHYRVLSTTPNPSCRLPSPPHHSEAVYGWYSSACRLDSMVQDDLTYASYPLLKHVVSVEPTAPMS